MISIPKKRALCQKGSVATMRKAGCVFISTHTCSHTHTHTPVAQKRQDREVGRPGQLPGAHWKCEVTSASSSASTQHWCHLGGGAYGFLPFLALSLSLFLFSLSHSHHAVFTVNARGSKRKKDENWAALNMQLEWALHVSVLKATRSLIYMSIMYVSKN